MLTNRVRIEFSSRMRRSAGRALPERGIVRLAWWLQDATPTVRDEVLCHEVAHIAARLIHGSKIRAHGPEWKALMRRAGYEPRVRLDPRLYSDLGNGYPAAPRTGRATTMVYVHRCPVCQAARIARRTVRGWRCAACVDAGLDGALEVYRLERRPRGMA